MQSQNVISPPFLLCNAVHHSKVSDEEKCTLVNETKWQYYGTPSTGGNLTVNWTHPTLDATHVNIEVWGYQETGKVFFTFTTHVQSSAQLVIAFTEASRRDLHINI